MSGTGTPPSQGGPPGGGAPPSPPSSSNPSCSTRRRTAPSIHRWFAALHRGQQLTQSEDGSTALTTGPSTSNSTYYTPPSPPPLSQDPDDDPAPADNPVDQQPEAAAQQGQGQQGQQGQQQQPDQQQPEQAPTGGTSSHAAHATPSPNGALPDPLGDSVSSDGFSSSLSDDSSDFPSAHPSTHLPNALADIAAPPEAPTTTVTPLPTPVSPNPTAPLPPPPLTADSAAPLAPLAPASAPASRNRKKSRSRVPSLRRLTIMAVASQLDTHLPTILTQAPLPDDVLSRLLRYMASVGLITATHLPAFRSVVRSISLSSPPYNMRVNDAWIALLAGAPLLQHIALSTAARITDAAMQTLSTVPNLVALELDYTAISDLGLNALAALPASKTSTATITTTTTTTADGAAHAASDDDDAAAVAAAPSWVSGAVAAFSALPAKPTKTIRSAMKTTSEPSMMDFDDDDDDEEADDPANAPETAADDSDEDLGLSLNPTKLTPVAPMARRKRKRANLRPRAAVLGRRKVPRPRPAGPNSSPSSDSSPTRRTAISRSSDDSSSKPSTTRRSAAAAATAADAADASAAIDAAKEAAAKECEAMIPLPKLPTFAPTAPPSLQELSLRGCKDVTSSGIAALGKVMSELKVLHLDSTGIKDGVVMKIIGESFPQLRELTMSNTQLAFDSQSLNLAHLASLKHLAVLSLDSSALSDAHLAGLAALASLRVLSLNDNPFGDAGLSYLAPLTGLLHLDISRTGVTDVSVPILGSSFPHLGFLGLYNTQITVAALSAENAPMHLTIAKNGTIAGEVAALIAYGPSLPRLACVILKAMSQMAFVPEAKAQIGERGGIAAIRATLAAHATDEQVQFRGLAMLWSLTLNEANRAAIAAKGGIDQILSSFHNHRSSRNVAHAVCGLFANMSVEDGIQDSIVDAGGIPAMLNAMEAHGKSNANPNVLVNATAVLWNISLRRHQDLMMQANVLPKLLVAMRTHPRCRNLIRNGTAIIWNVATKRENLAVIAAAGGLQDLLSILTQWAADEELVCKAGGALMLLPLDPANRHRLTELGAVPKVIQVIRQHSTNPRVLFQLFGVLWNLAPDTRVQEQIAKTGGIRDVLSAVSIFGADPQLMVRVTGLLWNTSIPRANQSAILAQNGAQAMLFVLRAHRNVMPIAVNATSTLWNLSVGMENKDALVPLLMEEVLALLASPMTASNPHLMRNVTSILWNLVQIPAGRAAFPMSHIRYLVNPLCGRAMPHHAVAAAGALHELAKSPPHVAAITASQGVLALHNALMVAPNDLQLLTAAMGALLFLIPSPSHPNLMVILHLLTASLTQPGRQIIPSAAAAPAPAAAAAPAVAASGAESEDGTTPPGSPATSPRPTVSLSAPNHVFEDDTLTARQVTAARTLALLSCNPTIGAAIVTHGLVAELCKLLQHPNMELVAAVLDIVGNIASHGGETLAPLLNPVVLQLLAAHSASPEPDVSFMARWAMAALYPTPQPAAGASPAAGLSSQDKTRYIKVDPAGREARNDTPYLESVAGTASVSSGKWYFEVEVVTEGMMQLGWTSASGPFEPAQGHGVGDSAHSWAYEPLHRARWHNRRDSSYGQRLRAGDIIGVLLDLDDGAVGGTLSYTHNGSNCGQAFVGLCSDALLDGGLVPAVSLTPNQHVKLNFGTAPWSFQPPSHYKGYALAQGESHFGRRPVRGYTPPVGGSP